MEAKTCQEISREETCRTLMTAQAGKEEGRDGMRGKSPR